MINAPRSGGSLRRELKIWEAFALSVGLMSPALAMSAAGSGAASIVGRGVPLAFLFAGLAVCLVAYGFVYLSRYYSHAGNVYGLTGITLGSRAGFLSGWALLGTYVLFVPAALLASGGFFAVFLDQTGLWHNASFLPISLVLVALVWLATSGDVKRLTRGLLGLEGVSVLVILILLLVIVAKLIGHSAPAHQTLTVKVFSFGSGVSGHAIALGAVFGFLAFAGFEAAASLGEETKNPRRNIPRAIAATVVGGTVFYFLCMTVQSMGFGTDPKGVQAFAGSSGSLFDLAHNYWSADIAYVLEVGASVSAFGAALGAAAGASRLLYALARDGAPRTPFARLSARSGAPTAALSVVMIVTAGLIVIEWLLGVDGLTGWGYLGTIGTLLLIVAYAMVNIGAVRHMFIHGERAGSWKAAIPILGVAALGYTLYNQLYPVPAAPFDSFPYVALAWLVLGLAIVLLAPGLAARIGLGLAREDGFADDSEPEPAPRTSETPLAPQAATGTH